MSSRQIITDAAEKAEWGPDDVVAVLCDYIDRQGAEDAFAAHVRQCAEEDTEEPAWVDKHSVNCYFCNALVDERECESAYKYNGGDGGDACPQCLKGLKGAEKDIFDEMKDDPGSFGTNRQEFRASAKRIAYVRLHGAFPMIAIDAVADAVTKKLYPEPEEG